MCCHCVLSTAPQPPVRWRGVVALERHPEPSLLGGIRRSADLNRQAPRIGEETAPPHEGVQGVCHGPIDGLIHGPPLKGHSFEMRPRLPEGHPGQDEAAASLLQASAFAAPPAPPPHTHPPPWRREPAARQSPAKVDTERKTWQAFPGPARVPLPASGLRRPPQKLSGLCILKGSARQGLCRPRTFRKAVCVVLSTRRIGCRATG